MKSGQLIECNTRDIFLEKLYSKCGGETSPSLFSKKLKLTVSLDQWFKVSYSLFLLYGKLRAIEIYGPNILKLSCRPFAFTSY